jgi:hypothetical protein
MEENLYAAVMNIQAQDLESLKKQELNFINRKKNKVLEGEIEEKAKKNRIAYWDKVLKPKKCVLSDRRGSFINFPSMYMDGVDLTLLSDLELENYNNEISNQVEFWINYHIQEKKRYMSFLKKRIAAKRWDEKTFFAKMTNEDKNVLNELIMYFTNNPLSNFLLSENDLNRLGIFQTDVDKRTMLDLKKNLYYAGAKGTGKTFTMSVIYDFLLDRSDSYEMLDNTIESRDNLLKPMFYNQTNRSEYQQKLWLDCVPFYRDFKAGLKFDLRYFYQNSWIIDEFATKSDFVRVYGDIENPLEDILYSRHKRWDEYTGIDLRKRNITVVISNINLAEIQDGVTRMDERMIDRMSMFNQITHRGASKR